MKKEPAEKPAMSVLSEAIKGKAQNPDVVKSFGANKEQVQKEEQKEEQSDDVDTEFDFDGLYTEPQKQDEKEERQEEQKEVLAEDEGNEELHAPTPKASAQWDALKQKRDKWKAKALEIEGELKALKENASKVDQAALEKRISDLEKELNEKSDHLSRIDFENSKEFRDTYIAPVEKITASIERLIPANLSEDVASELAEINKRMGALAGIDGRQNEYYQAVDDFVELAFQSKSAKSKGQALLGDLWDKANELIAAKDLKGKTREEAIRSRQTAEFRSLESIPSELSSELKAFEAENAPRVNVWRDEKLKDEFNYDEFKETSLKKSGELFSEFARTRKITPEIRKLLFAGAMAEMQERERQFSKNILVYQNKRIQELESILNSKGIQIKPRSSESQSSKKSEDSKLEKGKSIIFSKMKERNFIN